mgnify:CR=1 FL=1
MKITIVGIGYVGLSLSLILSRKHKVIAFDIDKKKIELINKKLSPIDDSEIKSYLKKNSLDIYATSNSKEAYEEADLIIISTPTNINPETGVFDTSSVELSLNEIFSNNFTKEIIIKSTVYFGFTEKMRLRHNSKKIIFSPEFLREGKSLHDNLYPSRIVVGDKSSLGKNFAAIMAKASNKKLDEVDIHYMTSHEAEAVKLFANSFLAMRVAFFNELDSFAEFNNISTKKIIKAVSGDNRIGNYYNNPSFGYGGYCLPKDTKQLLNNFNEVPNNLIKAIVESNLTRKKFIANSIIKKNPNTVGIYRLTMKSGSENFRDSAVFAIIDSLVENNISVILYEPLLTDNIIDGVTLKNNFQDFIDSCDLIVANRVSEKLYALKNKVYTRDLFNSDE